MQQQPSLFARTAASSATGQVRDVGVTLDVTLERAAGATLDHPPASLRHCRPALAQAGGEGDKVEEVEDPPFSSSQGDKRAGAGTARHCQDCQLPERASPTSRPHSRDSAHARVTLEHW